MAGTRLDYRDSVAAGEAYLRHYGVKGMKWGVIRNRLSGNAGKAREYIKPSADAREASKVRSKAKIAGVETLSNKDLQTVIRRMNLEVQYSQLKRAEFEASYVGMGKKIVGKFMGGLLKDLLLSTIRERSGGGSAGTYSWGSPGSSPGVINGSLGRPRAIGS